MNNKCLKRLQKEMKMINKDPLPYISIKHDGDNMLKWYFVIHNVKFDDKDDYNNGYYMGEIIIPDKYPFKAPDFIMKTPNGRFQTNVKICTTFTGFHPEEWSPKWTIQGMLNSFLSVMEDDSEHGLGMYVDTYENRRKYANNSLKYNKSIPEFNNLFSQF